MTRNILIVLSFGVGILTSCSSSGPYASSAADPSPTAKSAPKPPPEPKPETVWKCKILNGEGRTFTGVGASSTTAEIKARHDCEIYSRHCTLLECIPESE